MCPQERLCRIRAKDDENLFRPTVDRHNCPANWPLVLAAIRIENRQCIVRLNPNLSQGRLGYLRVGCPGVHPSVKRKAVAALPPTNANSRLESSHAAIVHTALEAVIITTPILVVP